jgi:alkylhydroperoxidase/carboxymuconolactone decarboxylase family protein YurZ
MTQHQPAGAGRTATQDEQDRKAYEWAMRPVSQSLGTLPVSSTFREAMGPSLSRVYSNPHLDIKFRRLVNIALDTALQRPDDQLRTHVLEALIDGSTPEEIEAIIENTMMYAGLGPAVHSMAMLVDCVAAYEEYCRTGG